MNGRDEIYHTGSEDQSQDENGRTSGTVTRLSDYQRKRFEGGEGARDEEQGVHSEITDRHLSRAGGKEGAGELLIMAREMFEFYCENGCRGYNLVPIDVEIDADVIVVCGNPKCQHEHYRRMKDGQITAIRHSTTKDTATVHRIELLPSAFSTTKRLKESEPTKNDPKGFMSSLWDRARNP